MPLLVQSVEPSLAEEYYLQLKYDLMVGSFDPGEKLSIRALSERTGLGAAPIREALKRLASERILESGVKRSFAVPDLDDKRIVDLINLRALLECHAAQQALGASTRKDIDQLGTLANRMQRQISNLDHSGYMRSNHRFHFLIYSRSGNQDLVSMIEQLWAQTGPSLYRGLTNSDPTSDTHDSHGDIVAALKSRNVEKLSSHMLSDINWAATHYGNTRPKTQS